MSLYKLILMHIKNENYHQYTVHVLAIHVWVCAIVIVIVQSPKKLVQFILFFFLLALLLGRWFLCSDNTMKKPIRKGSQTEIENKAIESCATEK